MSYRVEISEKVRRQLNKLDKRTALLITGWLRKNIEGCSNLRQYGKALSAELSGQWRYRVGDYRILAEIKDASLIVLALRVRHRKEIYKKQR